jgi:DNA repair protein RecO (recombination protein O)
MTEQPRSYQTEAIIIRRTKLGEADRILTLFTPEYGKLRAIAKGSRRPGSKFGGHVEMLTHSLLQLARGHNLEIVTQAQTINSFMPLREDLKRLSSGLYLAELVDAFISEDIEDRDLFDFVILTLKELSTADNLDTVLRYFELHLLQKTGYQPQLQTCSGCGARLYPGTNCFSAAHGGVLCVECGFDEPAARSISVNALKVLRLWQTCDYATAYKVNINPGLTIEMESILREYIRHMLEKQLKSTAFLDMLRQ